MLPRGQQVRSGGTDASGAEGGVAQSGEVCVVSAQLCMQGRLGSPRVQGGLEATVWILDFQPTGVSVHIPPGGRAAANFARNTGVEPGFVPGFIWMSHPDPGIHSLERVSGRVDFGYERRLSRVLRVDIRRDGVGEEVVLGAKRRRRWRSGS